MDYILFGAGTGASLAVIGWVLREWGPRLRDGKPDDGIIHSASELIDRMSWARFCASCGMAMVVAGTLILLATAVVAVWNPGDDLAGWILIGTYLFVSLLMMVWAFLYTRQFGTGGIYRPVTVDPASETREAVPVVQRDATASAADDAAESASDASSEADATSETPDSAPDFAEVAASRGGLSRFASFFNRQRPADPDQGDGGDDPTTEVEVVEVEADSSTDEEGVASEFQVAEVMAERVELSESGEEDIKIMDVEESEADATVGSAGDPSPVGPDIDTADGPAASPAEVTPEDEALAELRRRRLARLSGQKD